MRNALLLAANSWRESLRTRFFMISAVFSGVLLYVSLLFGLLAVDQELRVLLDFGLAFIELVGLAGALYGATTMVLRELETKTIYLVLTRPVSRGEYLAGRFAGLMLSTAVSLSLMCAFHLAILFWKGWHWQAAYALAVLGVYLKILITASLAFFLALFSSSVLTAGVFSAILWTLGHFLPEIRHLIQEGAPPAAMLPLTLLSKVVPDLQFFNLRDRLGAAAAPLAGWLGYAAAYSLVWLGLSGVLMRRKEF